ncbi:hypothetical protein ACQJBY_055279 [Aegilops geniculata]
MWGEVVVKIEDVAVRAVKNWQVERFLLPPQGCWPLHRGAMASPACGFHRPPRGRAAATAVHWFGRIPAIKGRLSLSPSSQHLPSWSASSSYNAQGPRPKRGEPMQPYYY